MDCLTEQDKALQEEVRAFVRDDVDKQLLRDMDEDKMRYPREYLQKAAARGLLGLRFPEKCGGSLPWTARSWLWRKWAFWGLGLPLFPGQYRREAINSLARNI